MMAGRKRKEERKKAILFGMVLGSLLILVGIGAFTYRLYARIVDESKTIAWEMTLKSAEMLELRLSGIRNDLLVFTRSLGVGTPTQEDAGQRAQYYQEAKGAFRVHVVADDGALLTESQGLTREEIASLEELCREDGVFSANYIGESGRWQTAVAYSGMVNGQSCRVYQECILNDLYLDEFMEFYDNEGYCYVISRMDGAFIMLPRNQYGQGLYSDLFTMLEAYRGNNPTVMEKIHAALERETGCTVPLKFRGEKSFFCFAPIEENADWFVVSVIPSSILQKNGITAIRAVLLLGMALLCGLFCLMAMSRHRWRLHYEVEAAKRADAAKTAFLSNVSHEMRTPMNAIIGMTEIMQLNAADQSRVQACIDKIHVSSRYLLRIINDVLDMSKIEQDKMALECQPFSITSVLDTAFDLILPQLRERGHRFAACARWAGPEYLLGDEKRIIQILVNILSNAVKYTPKGGDIRLRTFCKADEARADRVLVCFEVEDNGLGMSLEYQSMIFEPFSQEKNSLSRGTGLGMAIVNQMVRLMDGEISLVSKLNQGSTFRVSLPLPIALPEDEEEPALWGKRVLLAEADKEVLDGECHTLSFAGAETICTLSAGEALETLEQGEEVDMVLLDGALVSSVQALTEFAREKGLPLYRTGYGLQESDCDSTAWSQGFLNKPVFPSRLLNLTAGQNQRVSPQEDLRPLEGCRILLAEDNELNAEIAIELLLHFGAEVDHAADGQEVSDRFAQSETGWYDLILMDVQMPKMNGYDATKRIRAMERSDAACVPILAMTADVFSEDVARVLKCGMNGHIAKPVDIQVMLREIKRALGGEER